MPGNKAGVVYSVLMIIMYLWIIGWAIAGVIPIYSLLVLLTLPLVIKAIRGALHTSDMNLLMPGVASNVLIVLLVQLLLGAGYILDKFI